MKLSKFLFLFRKSFLLYLNNVEGLSNEGLIRIIQSFDRATADALTKWIEEKE